MEPTRYYGACSSVTQISIKAHAIKTTHTTLQLTNALSKEWTGDAVVVKLARVKGKLSMADTSRIDTRALLYLHNEGLPPSHPVNQQQQQQQQQTINESMNQSINQSINQSLDQSTTDYLRGLI